MAQHEQSITDLARGALNDARDLIREEIALAKAEMREEIAKWRAGALSLAAAAVAGLFAVLFLLTALARGIAVALGWDPWTGFAIVGALLVLGAVVLGYFGYSMLARERHMPRTMDILRENMAWMRGRTS